MSPSREELSCLRGLACVMLVSYHIIGGTPQEGLQMSSGPWRTTVDALAAIRMPLFACIAGAAHAYAMHSGRASMLDRLQRLLLPMLLVGTAFAGIQALFQGRSLADIDWLTLHWIPVAHYWFLPSLFWVTLIWHVLKYDTLKCVATGLLTAAYLAGMGSPVLGIAGAIYLFPYFALGFWLTSLSTVSGWPHLRSAPSRWGVFLVCMVLTLCLVLSLNNPSDQRLSLPMLLAGLISCLGFFVLQPQQRLFSALGRYAYPIFLFHVFFTAPVRQVLWRLGIESTAFHMLLGLSAALLGSIVLTHLIRQAGGPALLIIGEGSSLTARRPSRPPAASTPRSDP